MRIWYLWAVSRLLSFRLRDLLICASVTLGSLIEFSNARQRYISLRIYTFLAALKITVLIWWAPYTFSTLLSSLAFCILEGLQSASCKTMETSFTALVNSLRAWGHGALTYFKFARFQICQFAKFIKVFKLAICTFAHAKMYEFGYRDA